MSQHPAQALFNQNLAFFEKHYPYLYQVAKHTPFTKLTLNIDDQGKIDVHSGNAMFYAGDARTYAEQEVAKFYQNIDYGKPFSGLHPYEANSFAAPRFFSQAITRLYENFKVNPNQTYHVPKFYPMLVVMGIGTGHHIERLVAEKNILTLIIYETDPEEFLVSMYTIDWAKIIQAFNKKGHSIRLMVADIPLARFQYANLWNELIQHPPSFSLATYLYNHRNRDKYAKLSKKIQKDMTTYLSLWGYYDDEINQFNNGLHNLYNGHKLLPKQSQDTIDTPVFIVGSGPSLDKRIEDIKKYKDKAIILSAGTALRALHKEGIKPDFQIEIESHYESVRVMEEINDPDYLKDINLIGAVQLTPKLLDFFKDTRLFVKDSTALGAITGTQVTDICSGTTPTCTNTALAIAGYFKCSRLYFFGTDYGFKNLDSHHSKHSVYYSEEQSDAIEKATSSYGDYLIEVESVDGEKMQSTPIYNTSRRRVEVEIQFLQTRYELVAKNCSEGGAKIEGVDYISHEDFNTQMEQASSPKQVLMTRILNQNSHAISAEEIATNLSKLTDDLTHISQDIISIMSKGNHRSLTKHYQNMHIIGQYLSFGMEKYGQMKFMVRGTIWHFLHAGASYALKLQDNPKELNRFIKTWEKSFRDYLNDYLLHFKQVTTKTFDNSDPWLRMEVDDPIEQNFEYSLPEK